MVRKYALETMHDVCEGKGQVDFEYWMEDADKTPNMSMCATLYMHPGAVVGDHYHRGDTEIYRISSGRGKYNDNGKTVEVEPGDVLFCYDGQVHGMENIGEDMLIFDAVIINS